MYCVVFGSEAASSKQYPTHTVLTTMIAGIARASLTEYKLKGGSILK